MDWIMWWEIICIVLAPISVCITVCRPLRDRIPLWVCMTLLIFASITLGAFTVMVWPQTFHLTPIKEGL